MTLEHDPLIIGYEKGHIIWRGMIISDYGYVKEKMERVGSREG